MTIHESWTDRLSDYLDDELPDEERTAVAAHLAECAECARTLEELKAVVATASSLRPTMPRGDLWSAIAERMETSGPVVTARAPRRLSFTLPELAAASLLLSMLSGGAVVLVLNGSLESRPTDFQVGATEPVAPGSGSNDSGERDVRIPDAAADARLPVDVLPAVSFADAQFDAAVADLERALQNGRGRLDAETVAIVQENLAIIDQAMAEARDALATDPADSHLSGHLMDARRRKLDLLRRATELTDAN